MDGLDGLPGGGMLLHGLPAFCTAFFGRVGINSASLHPDDADSAYYAPVGAAPPVHGHGHGHDHEHAADVADALPAPHEARLALPAPQSGAAPEPPPTSIQGGSPPAADAHLDHEQEEGESR
jgi:hypothetical protein